MTKIPTKREAEEMLERAERATPGPWTLDPNYQCYIWGPQSQMVADDGGDEEGTLTRMRGVGANLPLARNGDFLAHARADVPALVRAYMEAVAALAPFATNIYDSDHTTELIRAVKRADALLRAYHADPQPAAPNYGTDSTWPRKGEPEGSWE